MREALVSWAFYWCRVSALVSPRTNQLPFTLVLGALKAAQGHPAVNRICRSDILWQGSDGTPVVWLLNGPSVTAFSPAGSFNPGTDWHIIG
jgi:hypothetical protein